MDFITRNIKRGITLLYLFVNLKTFPKLWAFIPAICSEEVLPMQAWDTVLTLRSLETCTNTRQSSRHKSRAFT